jgi:cellulose synthase/poly-beta-1,6-N-acetylglucosamine synthase-like glycosyltransferase
MKKSIYIISGLVIFTTILFFLLPNREIILISFVVAILSTSYFLILTFLRSKYGFGRFKRRTSYSIMILSLIFIVLPFIVGVIAFSLYPLSISSFFYGTSMAGFTLTLFYDLLNIPLALHHKRQDEEINKRVLTSYPLITIIVPAYNEEKCIEKTIETLLEVDYPNKEIIVVDDGSVDRTYEIASRYIKMGLKVLHRENGGKWAALNYGLFFSKGEIIVVVDADSLVSRVALREIAKRFQDPNILGLAGNVKVLNRNNFLTRCQALEYVTDINIAKRAFAVMGSTMVVPGCLGAFRREALLGTGSFDPDTVTEDFDATLKVLKVGGVVQTSSYASAYTEAPESLRDLYRQRLRWYRGTFQSLLKHRNIITTPIFDFLSFIGYPYILLSLIFIPICGIIALISGIIASLTGWLINFTQILLLFIFMEFMFSLLAIQLDDEDIKLALYSPLFVIGYRHLRDVIKLKSLFDVLLKREIRWTKVRRIGRAYEIIKYSKTA